MALTPVSSTDEFIKGLWRDNPVFVRLLADHLASMTDTFALAEYERLHSALPRGGGPSD